MNSAIPFAKDVLPKLVTVVVLNAALNATNKFERKISGRSNQRIHFILNEDMDDIIRILQLPEDSGVLVDGVTKVVKHENKQEGGFLVLFQHL